MKPDFGEAFYNRGMVKCNLELFEAAIDDFSKAIQIIEDYPQAYIGRSFAYSELGRDLDSMEDFNKVFQLITSSELKKLKS